MRIHQWNQVPPGTWVPSERFNLGLASTSWPVAGDYMFMAYLFGEIHVLDLKTGKLARILSMGPEVDGGSAWEDSAMGLRVTETKSGEYLILDENSRWGGKDNFIRWKP